MLRRSILQLSSRRFFRRIPRHISSERPLYYSSAKQFSKSSQSNPSPNPGSAGEPPESGSYFPKVAVGGVAIGAAILAAYKAGYLDQYLDKEQQKPFEAAKGGIDRKEEKNIKDPGAQLNLPSSVADSSLSSNADQPGAKVESLSDVPHSDVSSERIDQSRAQHKSDAKNVHDASVVTPQEGATTVPEKEFPEDSNPSILSAESRTDHETLPKESVQVEQPEIKASPHLVKGVQGASISSPGVVPEENERKETLPQPNAGDRQESTSSNEVLPEKSLLDEYYLRDSSSTYLNRENPNQYEDLSEEGAFIAALDDLKDGYMSKDGKLIFDFLQAIHAAEKRQAELDARTFAEEKRALKEKYEKELKDAIAREFMRAEEAAILDKELKRERAKAAAAIKTFQEKAEEKLKTELEQKEKEAELKLKKADEIAKAELAAVIAKEKAAQIEKIAEADLNINALCMAFFARSEEARQSHSVHKLALGALALEDALSKGLPIQKEIEALHSYLKGTNEESILELVLSSLPAETRNRGTDTFLQLKQKFNDLKGTLRHFSLIPPGGGGLVAHTVAQFASWLRVKESGQSGDGIESVINKVEGYLAEGKLAEAADALEEGVKSSQAAEIAKDWAKRARDRAVTEQAMTFLQAYVTSVSLI